jgi:hypothetical protein
VRQITLSSPRLAAREALKDQGDVAYWEADRDREVEISRTGVCSNHVIIGEFLYDRPIAGKHFVLPVAPLARVTDDPPVQRLPERRAAATIAASPRVKLAIDRVFRHRVQERDGRVTIEELDPGDPG